MKYHDLSFMKDKQGNISFLLSSVYSAYSCGLEYSISFPKKKKKKNWNIKMIVYFLTFFGWPQSILDIFSKACASQEEGVIE